MNEQPATAGHEIPVRPADSRWTPDQWRAIHVRRRRILVAAAAGSGKTAVLVERIIRRITDDRDPLDIDRLLVATFTNAAAAEMRERVREALERRLFEQPDDEHLLRQLMLLGRAKITTLHAFCLEVVRKYFYLLQLDPGFRIANDTEAELLRQDVLEELFEDYYRDSEETSPFWRLIDWFGGERSDEAVFRLVLRLYDFSRSHPHPEQWLHDSAASFASEQPAGRNALALWTSVLLDHADLELEGAAALLEEAVRLAAGAGGPAAYGPVLHEDARQVEELRALSRSRDWDGLCEAFAALGFGKLKPVKKGEADEALQDQVKSLREQAKKQLTGLKTAWFSRRMAAMTAELAEAAPVMEVLAAMTSDFAERYSAAKRGKGLVDFADLEHYCLQALTDPEGVLDQAVPSVAAEEYRSRFRELLIDEYQDTNRVQEAILTLIAGDETAWFMVGDVKQSIYRFRLADPGLFLEKYKAYTSLDEPADADEVRIDLSRNFRSRREVLDFVNGLFRRIMHERAAELDYDRQAELVPGADFPELPQALRANRIEFPEDLGRTSGGKRRPSPSPADDALETVVAGLSEREVAAGWEAGAAVEKADGSGAPPGEEAMALDDCPELVLIDRSGTGETLEQTDSSADSRESADRTEAEKDAEGGGDPTAAQLEGRYIARRIREWMGLDGSPPLPVADRRTGALRKPQYRDMVVLLRATESWAPILVEELRNAGIPAHAESRSGYFAAVEVETMLSLLQVIDNPLQDIPLAGVLHSPIFGFTAAELAEIRLAAEQGAFYDALNAYAGKEIAGNLGLQDKTRRFLSRLADWRRQARFSSLADFIWTLYRDTGYPDMAGGMPGGAARQANLRALYDRARQYDSTSFRGLFRFLRFIERLRDSGGDLGAPSVVGEQEDVVRILSIHKSKGLEFPIVFIAGLGKSFNTQDLRQPMLLHKDLGLGPRIVDTKLSVSYPSLPAMAIGRKLKAEALAEEMRILYVALTRPREKMVLVGCVKQAARQIANWAMPASRTELRLATHAIVKAGSYLDWLMPAFLAHPALAGLRQEAGLGSLQATEEARAGYPRLRASWLPAERLAQEAKRVTSAWLPAGELLDAVRQAEPVALGSSYGAEAVRRLEWRYPENRASQIYSKTSVTELKRQSDQVAAARASAEEEELPAAAIGGAREEFRSLGERPRFLESGGLTATERGTAYHAVMQHLRLDEAPDAETVRKTVEKMREAAILSSEQASAIDPGPILKFLHSDPGRRMRQSPRVRREIPFSIGLPAGEVYLDLPEDMAEPVLVQGVIDCLFDEGDGLVLLDYKTDAVRGRRPIELAERYRLQIDLYARAVESIMGRPVVGKYLYFFDGGHGIEMN